MTSPMSAPTSATTPATGITSARFAQQNVLVTGGGSGIGQAVAEAFAGEGAAVVVAGRSADKLARTVETLTSRGSRALAVRTDITRSDQVAGLVARTVEELGSLDIAVNCAGTLAAGGPVSDLDEDEWARLLDVNLTGTMLSMRHEIRHMRRFGRGTIVNISSTIGAHARFRGTAAYGAGKAALSALTRAAALDHCQEGIRINAVSPGPVDTAMSYLPSESRADRDARYAQQLPAGRVATVTEVAAAVLFLASPQAAFCVGTDLVMDGGAAA
ncbi:SDR family NAD(P)-dependent oxidoreductase [Streptomyces sp. PU-14G]|uniref:SDR family NAD(P)-dependent oxidoreductase n=1 Tax=Streptomyces sp. PU-14G TaxID=2800808 RepID=UPI0034E02A5C